MTKTEHFIQDKKLNQAPSSCTFNTTLFFFLFFYVSTLQREQKSLQLTTIYGKTRHFVLNTTFRMIVDLFFNNVDREFDVILFTVTVASSKQCLFV